jgi:multidrug efflux pump subunit AcrA (membrane-fusion protein)
VKEGKAAKRRIVVGDFVRNSVVVSEGLTAGDTVVVAGQQKLYSGAKVKLQ